MALLLPVFLLLSLGIADVAHAWYLKQLVNNASREGARYGTQYPVSGSGLTRPPSSFTPTISDWVSLSQYGDYSSRLPSLSVSPTGAGYTGVTPGLALTVTVSAVKTWWIVGTLIPSLGNSITLTSATTMYLE
jgi:hypothetical protein